MYTYLASTFALAAPIILSVLVLTLLTALVIIQMRLSISLEKSSRIVGVLLAIIDASLLVVAILMIVIESILSLYIVSVMLLILLIVRLVVI